VVRPKGAVAERAVRRNAGARKRVNSGSPVQAIRVHLTRREKALSAGLALATLILYFRTFRYDFVFYDDNTFVYENPVVRAGLKAASIAWAFGLHFANWHPLTWISYLIDAQLFGMNAGGFHLVNVLLHTASVVLLFVALFRMTARPWRCAVVAAIFALHPLHVESVAWVAERKDVLSTLLEMIALLLYAKYAERPTTKRYLLVGMVFGLSLMAKPMLVTFPVILLLLDYWPLRRIEWPPQWPRDRGVALEKVPLLLLSLAASIATMVAQRSYGTVASLAGTPVTVRIQNAAIGYVAYIHQAFWPVNLGVLYPAVPPVWSKAEFALVILLVVTAAAVVLAGRLPYLFTGWFWYLVMLLPVIGLVQVGAQSRADRYMYVPLVGLTLAIVWGAADWLESRRALRTVFAVATGVVLLAFAVGTWRQVGYWKNSRTLFEHTIAVTHRNYIMRNNLGVVLARAGDDKGAMAQYVRAMVINPQYAEAKGNLGNALLRAGQLEAARPLLWDAIRLKPEFPMAQLDIGIIYANLANYPEAIRHLSEALRLSPEDPEVHSNFCYALEHAGRLDEAIAQCREALRLRPSYPDAQFNLKNALAARR
jgi:Tfp pilus assembly protein PilF